MNSYGYFDTDVKKQKGSKIKAFEATRPVSPNSVKLRAIDEKYGGKPKDEQMVREGHYPKFSEMIDKMEEIAMQFVKYEQFLDTTKT